MTVIVALRARREAEVHQMGDGSLALAAAGGTHGDLCRIFESTRRSRHCRATNNLRIPQWHPRLSDLGALRLCASSSKPGCSVARGKIAMLPPLRNYRNLQCDADRGCRQQLTGRSGPEVRAGPRCWLTWTRLSLPAGSQTWRSEAMTNARM